MKRYQILLGDELDKAYGEIAEELGMSMEQVLSSVVQLYAQRLTLQEYESICDTARIENYSKRSV